MCLLQNYLFFKETWRIGVFQGELPDFSFLILYTHLLPHRWYDTWACGDLLRERLNKKHSRLTLSSTVEPPYWSLIHLPWGWVIETPITDHHYLIREFGGQGSRAFQLLLLHLYWTWHTWAVMPHSSECGMTVCSIKSVRMSWRRHKSLWKRNVNILLRFRI